MGAAYQASFFRRIFSPFRHKMHAFVCFLVVVINIAVEDCACCRVDIVAVFFVADTELYIIVCHAIVIIVLKMCICEGYLACCETCILQCDLQRLICGDFLRCCSFRLCCCIGCCLLCCFRCLFDAAASCSAFISW